MKTFKFNTLVINIFLLTLGSIFSPISKIYTQIVFEENFNYPAGDSIGAHGWYWNTGFINTVFVTSPGLTYPGYPLSGIGNATTLNSTGNDAYKELNGSDSTGSFYASFLVRVDSARAQGDYFLALLQTGSTAFYEGRVQAAFRNGNLTFGITKANTTSDSTVAGAWTTGSYSLGTTYLLVLKYTFVPGGSTNDQVSLFVFSSGVPATEPSPTLGPLSYTSLDATAIGRIALRQGGGSARAPSCIVDGIRVVKSWGSIIDTTNIDFCRTPSNSPDFLKSIQEDQLMLPHTNSCCIKIFVHIMRQSNGSGGLTQSEVDQALRFLDTDFNPHNICFKKVGQDEILNTSLYNKSSFVPDNNGDGKFDDFSPNPHSDAIDVYLFGNDRLNYGMASQIVSTALVIGGNFGGASLPSSRVLSHEMAHCLGLYHTFHGMPCEPGACEEFVNGNTKYTCGDYVFDTPADPTLFNVNPISCVRNPGLPTCKSSNTDPYNDTYNPNLSLIMAYVPPNCMQNHTQGQGDRMGLMITNSPLLKATLETNCFNFDINGGSGKGSNNSADTCKYWFANSKAPLTIFPSRPDNSWVDDPPCRMKLIENGVNQAGSKLVGGMDDGYFRLSLKDIQLACGADTSKRLKLCGVCKDSLFIATNGIIGFSEHPDPLLPNYTWLDWPGNYVGSFIDGNYNRPAIYPFWLDFDFSYPDSTGGINGVTCGIKNNQLLITYSRAKVFNIPEYVSFQVCYELVNCVDIDANIKFTYSSTSNGRTSPGFITRYKNSNYTGGAPYPPNIGPYMVGIAPKYIFNQNDGYILYRKTDFFGHMVFSNGYNAPIVNRPLFFGNSSGLSVEFGQNPFELGKCKCNTDNFCPVQCLTNNLNISTGFNHENNTLYPNNSIDKYWQIVSAPSSMGLTLPRLTGIVSGVGPWCNKQPCSKWISIYPDLGYPSYPYCADQCYTFQTCFYVCADTSTVNINIVVGTDDGGLVYLDGNLIGGPTGFGCPGTTINLTRLLSRGEHFIQIKLSNGGGGPMGINVCGNITGNNLLKHECWNCTRLVTGGIATTEVGPFLPPFHSIIKIIDPKSPFNVLDSAIVYSDSLGRLLAQFKNPISDGEYYIAIASDNTIETWSANPVTINGDSISYDFTTSASQAYGNNMKFINGKWSFYSGDVNQDGFIDASDILQIYNASSSFVSGYAVTDLNGDSITDLNDLILAYNNATNFVQVQRP